MLKALQAKPEVLANIKLLEIGKKAELEALAIKSADHSTTQETERIKENSLNYRAELNSGDPYVRRMRPSWGYVLMSTWAILMLAISYAIAWRDVDDVVKIIKAVSTLEWMWITALGVLGIYIKKRSDDKNPQKGIGMFGALAERIKGK